MNGVIKHPPGTRKYLKGWRDLVGMGLVTAAFGISMIAMSFFRWGSSCYLHWEWLGPCIPRETAEYANRCVSVGALFLGAGTGVAMIAYLGYRRLDRKARLGTGA